MIRKMEPKKEVTLSNVVKIIIWIILAEYTIGTISKFESFIKKILVKKYLKEKKQI